MSDNRDDEFKKKTKILGELKKNVRELSELSKQLSKDVKKIKPAMSSIVKIKGRCDIKHQEISLQNDLYILSDATASAENHCSGLEHNVYQI